ncbi:MAG: hypothetical protein ABF990_05165 [Acetobacter sp.]
MTFFDVLLSEAALSEAACFALQIMIDRLIVLLICGRMARGTKQLKSTHPSAFFFARCRADAMLDAVG